MSNLRDDSTKELMEMENWLTKLFLDPLTTQLDETTFHIDFFETDEEYIIEAILTDFQQKEISVYLKERSIYIYADGLKKTGKKYRIIEFPFLIVHKKVSASFKQGILEIYISKERCKYGNNRQVPIL